MAGYGPPPLDPLDFLSFSNPPAWAMVPWIPVSVADPYADTYFGWFATSPFKPRDATLLLAHVSRRSHKCRLA